MISGRNQDGNERDVSVVAVGSGNGLVTAPLQMGTLLTQSYNMDGNAMALPDLPTPAGFSLVAPSTNAATVYFGGSAAAQPVELPPGSSVTFANLQNASAVWVDGTAGDDVIIVAEV